MSKKLHPTALIDPQAELAEEVEVGAYTVIEGKVRLEKGCCLRHHVYLKGEVTVGEGTFVGCGTIIGEDPQDSRFDPRSPSSVQIGKNNVIREYVTINRASREGGVTEIGEGNYLMTMTHLGHDVVLGDYNVVANNCLLAGFVRVGNSTFLGGGAKFHQFVRLGDLCMVQGNASITKDVPPYVTVVENNRILGLNVVGLRRAGIAPEIRKDIKKAFAEIYCSGKNLTQALDAVVSQKEWGKEVQWFIDFFSSENSNKGICMRLA